MHGSVVICFIDGSSVMFSFNANYRFYYEDGKLVFVSDETASPLEPYTIRSHAEAFDVQNISSINITAMRGEKNG